jgi:hypothetical protein
MEYLSDKMGCAGAFLAGSKTGLPDYILIMLL